MPESLSLEKRRVVVTGLGAVTPLGNTREAFWEALIAGKSGVAPITLFDPQYLTTHFAAEVKNFDAGALLGKKDARRMDRFAQFAVVAADEAIADANFPEDREIRDQTGTIVATGIGGITTLQDQVMKCVEPPSVSRISPFFVPMLMGNSGSAQISMKHHLRGPLYAVSSACSSGVDGIAAAYETIVRGDAIAMVTGGARRRSPRSRSADSAR